jgi:hypothetical protein
MAGYLREVTKSFWVISAAPLPLTAPYFISIKAVNQKIIGVSVDFKALPTSASIAQPILPAFRIRRPVALAIARDNNIN